MRWYPRGPAGVLVVAAIAVAAYAAAPAADQQAVHTIAITYNAQTGAVAASPDTIVARPGERIQWTSAYQWRVDVARGASIFGPGQGKGQGQGRAFQGGPNQSAGGPVIPAAAQGGYKYSVAVFIGGQWRTRDPEIIIAPPR